MVEEVSWREGSFAKRREMLRSKAAESTRRINGPAGSDGWTYARIGGTLTLGRIDNWVAGLPDGERSWTREASFTDAAVGDPDAVDVVCVVV